jgi:hypothetical protein
MLIIGSVNIIILYLAATVNSMVGRLILSIAGISMFLTLTKRQGDRISRMSRAKIIKNLLPERRKAIEEAYDIVMKKDKDTDR